jgi:hypothetical protein
LVAVGDILGFVLFSASKIESSCLSSNLACEKRQFRLLHHQTLFGWEIKNHTEKCTPELIITNLGTSPFFGPFLLKIGISPKAIKKVPTTLTAIVLSIPSI